MSALAAAALEACAAPPSADPTPEPPARAQAPPATTTAAAPEPEPTPPCPEDMALVEGLFCPAAEQRCQEAAPDGTDRCLRFEAPSRCASSRRTLLRYCIDRYEWPNRRGELPRVLVDFAEARAACAGVGKRVCDEHEWLFACEGEEMLPYTTGYERDSEACAMDRSYVPRPRRLARWEECLASPACRRDFERVDQREASGALARCRSPFGVHDLNGNVNEWVNLPGESYPHRSGLKGGWWGPVRDRCRPTVRFHDESDWGYEIGFRCCADARP